MCHARPCGDGEAITSCAIEIISPSNLPPKPVRGKKQTACLAELREMYKTQPAGVDRESAVQRCADKLECEGGAARPLQGKLLIGLSALVTFILRVGCFMSSKLTPKIPPKPNPLGDFVFWFWDCTNLVPIWFFGSDVCTYLSQQEPQDERLHQCTKCVCRG